MSDFPYQKFNLLTVYMHKMQTVKNHHLVCEYGKIKHSVPEAHPTQTLSPISHMQLAPAISNYSA